MRFALLSLVLASCTLSAGLSTSRSTPPPRVAAPPPSRPPAAASAAASAATAAPASVPGAPMRAVQAAPPEVDTTTRDCANHRNHCIRERGWFVVGVVTPGQWNPATPAYERGGRFYSYRGDLLAGNAYRTMRAGTLRVGKPVIVLLPTEEEPWPTSELGVLQSERWRVGVVDSIGNDGTFRIWEHDERLPIANARITIEGRRAD